MSDDQPTETVVVFKRVGEIAAAVGASLGFVYFVGAAVMWLRFRQAGLPPDQAVALMGRQDLLVIGVRLMVLPALFAGGFAWVLTRWSLRDRPPQRLLHRPDSAWKALAGVAAGLVVLAFVLLLPLSFASATWIAGGALIVGAWRWQVHEGRRPRRLGGRPPSRWAMVAAAMLAAGVVSLGRQLDQPVQLLSTAVNIEGADTPVEGVYVSASGDSVFVGRPADGTIIAVPRGKVTAVTVGPPETRSPSPSLLSRAIDVVDSGSDDFAITPFEWWCNGQRYRWGELGDLCQTQLEILDRSFGLDAKYAPVKVRCPPQAEDGCRGYLQMKTVKRYRLGRAALPRPVTLRPVALRLRAAAEAAPPIVPPGSTGFLCPEVNADVRGLLRNVAAEGEPRPTPAEIPFDVKVTTDAAGHNVIREVTYTLHVPAPGKAVVGGQSECTALK
ncbi:MAG: hypothetical protein JHC95_19040 [Solirubrobacteraceae bacterium]|nr:hypothetical protein [Solirubrobacteraceae bacterium]